MAQRLDNEKKFHDQLFAGNQGRGVGKFYSVTKVLDQYIENLLLSDCAGKKILEYGCGKGSYAFLLARNNAEVTGIDISRVAIDRARQQAVAQNVSDHTRFLVMDAERLEFQENSFDVVCGSGILHHLNLERALSEIGRVITPTGKAIFVEPMGENPFITLYRAMTPKKRTTDEHPLKFQDFCIMSHIFSEVEMKFFNACTLMLVPLRRVSFFDRLLIRISKFDDFLFSVFPITRRFAWSVVLQLSHKTLKKGKND